MMTGDKMRGTCHRQMMGLLFLVSVLATGAQAQTVEFDQLVHAEYTTALLEHQGLVIGGVQGGGLIFWNATDHSQHERLTSGRELSSNNVTDLAWSGRFVWVATAGGGLTQISNVTGNRSYRPYTSNLGSLNVNVVTGLIVGQSERVYYGMDGSGVGLITDGLSGAIWTKEQDGLISNTVTALQVFDGDLFVGTPVGISRFANNLFTNQNSGLGNLEVHDLTLDTDGNLLAGTEAGVYQWAAGSETWSLVGGITNPAQEVSCNSGLIYVRSNTVVRVYNGTSWQTLSTPSGSLGSIYAGDDFWIGGEAATSVSGQYRVSNAYLGRLAGGSTFDVQEIAATQAVNTVGVGFSGSDPYMGAWDWLSVVSSRHEGTWNQLIYKSDLPENEGNRLAEGQVLVMDSGPDEDMWISLFAGTGLAHVDAATGWVDLITPQNSGLLGKRIVGIVVHPDGPVITTHDGNGGGGTDIEKVEILVDPDDWGNPSQWMTLPLTGGLGDALHVWDAVVQRRDVVWFAVQDVGVVRWDINGDEAGPDDPLTWLDQSDDRWDEPVVTVSGSNLDLRGAVGLEVGEDGSIWAGGTGLLQFSYDEETMEATKITSIGEKATILSPGLVNGNVRDVVRDANGDIWVTTMTGINRVRGTGSEVEIDAYIDLGNYFANPNYVALYSPNVISPLPGVAYSHIAASADRKHIIVGADQGASVISVFGHDTEGPSSGPVNSSAYLYPNPYMGESAGLKLGNLPDGAEATVEIYNMDGQRIFSTTGVNADTVFWQGQNRVGNAVVTGLYVVRVTTGQASWALTLSVVR